MAGLFPCSWSQPLVRRQRQPKLLNAGVYNPRLPIQQPKPTRLYLPAVIPADEICSLVADEELDQSVQQIQREADANYDAKQVLKMTKLFNHNLDGAIERLNTLPPQEKSVVEPPQLLDLMVCVSRYSHILEGCIKNNQS